MYVAAPIFALDLMEGELLQSFCLVVHRKMADYFSGFYELLAGDLQIADCKRLVGSDA